jgi:threonine dehydrogenase-like Zn-dependent dehydrogenase
MDSQDLKQPVRQLVTKGNGVFIEQDYLVPMLLKDEIRVRAVMTGICRSDIDMMTGDFTLLPTEMHGHEGLGQVIAVGNNIDDCVVGDYVATRGEPAYADVYNCKKGTYCVVPEAHPDYIIEPVACAVNMELVCQQDLVKRDGGKMLIIGTGFLARVFHQTIVEEGYDYEIDVIGKSNGDYWREHLKRSTGSPYDVVVDLKGEDKIKFVKVNPNALVIMASAPHREYNFPLEDWLWNNVTIKMPSPRAETFHSAMIQATRMVAQGKIELDNVWTRGYNRETNWQQAFSDALTRPEGYSRGYIKWD